VNLHDIKNSLSPKDTTARNTYKKNQRKSLRWNAINASRQNERSEKKSVSDGLWNALPLFGGGAADNSDTVSVRSSTSSKYRDEEGQRLLDAAAKRLNNSDRNERVSLNTSVEEREYGENDSEDEESEFRRRVILDKEGNLTYDEDFSFEPSDLHSRRMNNYYWRRTKRHLSCLLAVTVSIGILFTFGALGHKRLTRSSEEVVKVNGGTNNSQVDVLEDDEWYLNGVPMTERFEEIKAHLLEYEVTQSSAFDDVHSAQYAALKWLADDDPRQLHPTNEYLVQRYGLVTLWFSTTKTEYEWHIPAEYGGTGDNNLSQRRLESSNGTSVWTKHKNWLTEKGICEWQGIECNSSNEDADGDVLRISMKKNNMHGLICKEIYTTLPKLQYADLSDNGFTGILSAEIGLWNELTYLNFTGNRIGGSIPREIGELSQLKVLHFADNLLEKSIPHTIGDLSILRDLDLSGNELKGTMPWEMGQLFDLISVNLGETYLVFVSICMLQL
jgi:hypothetical protein